MLPPSDDGDEDRDYPFDRDDYNDNLYESYEQATDVYDALSEYFHDTGFTNEQWFDMIDNIENMYYDDEGNIHFDFHWDDGDPYGYSGSGSI